MIRHLRDLGIPAAGHVVAIRGSSAKETLVEVAENLHAGLLVIGSHARAGMERLLLGSVAEGVIRRSGVPVLVIPPAAVIAPVDR
jgi:nucleotide-binding universal stress UspA family protein